MSINMESVITDFLEGSIATIGKRPVIEEKTITENGDYTAPTGVDGFSPVHVAVPEPNLVQLNANSNGTYTPSGSVDGYNKVVVSVPEPIISSLTITENGVYTPPTGVDGYNEIIANIPAPTIRLEDKTITSNGTYTHSSGYDGLGEVTVNVPSLTLDYYKNNTLVYNTNNTTTFAYDNDKTLGEGWYIASLSWYDYNQDRVVNRLFYYGGSGAVEIFRVEGGYNFNFIVYAYPTYTQFQLTSGMPFNCYCKLTKVFNEQIY